MTERVLVIEDDATLRRVLKDNLEAGGYEVVTAADGEEGLRLALDSKPRLIVLDVMLPAVNGYEICRFVRREGNDVPIIMLTAKGQESDVVLGLEIGADDYVTKPFSVKELMARVHAFLRRRRAAEPELVRFGEFELCLASRRLLRSGGEVELTPKELDLLVFLSSRPGRALTRDEIVRAVWGFDSDVTSRSVDRCVTTLRSKIEANPRRPRFIKTLRDVGYRFDPD